MKVTIKIQTAYVVKVEDIRNGGTLYDNQQLGVDDPTPLLVTVMDGCDYGDRVNYLQEVEKIARATRFFNEAIGADFEILVGFEP